MAGRVVTLDINSSNIRLLETDGRRVTKWANRSLEPGVFRDEAVANPQVLATAVRQLIRSSGISGGNVTASVSGLYSLNRVVMVGTPLGIAATHQAVLDAVREVLPLSEEELYLSWHSVAAVEGGQQVLVIAVPRDVIDGQMQAMRLAGMKPNILEFKAIALARAVGRQQALIFNIEPASLDIIIIVGGVAEVMRTTAGLPLDLAVEERAEKLATTLELTVGFYNSHHPGFPLDPATPLFVTGQMSGDLTLVERLQARVGYPLESLAPPLEYPSHLPVSQYATNIGLALRGIVPPQNPEPFSSSLPSINLLPQAYRAWRPSARQIYIFLGLVVAIALLFPLYQVTTEVMKQTGDLKTRYSTINTELQRRQAEIAKRDPLQAAVNEYNSIVALGGGSADDVKVINSIAAKLGITLGSISHDGGSIQVAVTADNYTAFRDYLTNLAGSGRFATPIPPPEGYPYIKSGNVKLQPKASK